MVILDLRGLEDLAGLTECNNLPGHPTGEVIQELCFEPTELPVTKAAQLLDISETTWSQLLHGQVGISPDLAIHLAMAFDTTPESWLWMQVQYDLWQARQNYQYVNVQHLQIDS